MPRQRADTDSPWKDLLERFFRPFLALCFPLIEAAIDWTRGIVFLDKELQARVRDAHSGRLYVDKLVQVWRKDGTPQRIFIHVEIQSQPDPRLPQRLYRYFSRLSEACPGPVVSLVVLADADPHWRPQRYESAVWGCQICFEFPVCKLLDLPEATLKAAVGNPVALLVLAHRAAQRTRQDPHGRKGRKLELLRELGRQGWEKQEILEVYRLLDWLMPLPERHERELQEELETIEKDNVMPYISSAERFGLEKGLQTGRQEGLQTGLLTGAREGVLEALELRFGAVPPEVRVVVEQTDELEELRRWHRQAITSPTLDVFAQMMSTGNR